MGFSRLHVFPYSPREGTPAAAMDGQVAEAVKAQRVHRLIALGGDLSRRYREGFLGQCVPVLLEEALAGGGAEGYTPEYVHVCVRDGRPGALAMVRLDTLTEEGMAGTVVEYLP